MDAEVTKSPLQFEYEIEKTRKELASLKRNWKQKKEASLTKLLGFRAEKKELDAVLAETERGYRAYCLLLEPIANLESRDPDLLQVSLQELGRLHPALATCMADMLQQAQGLATGTDGTETRRVFQAREAHKTAAEQIQRKTREVYAAMKEEKENVTAYANRLTHIIQDKKEQCQRQTKIYGMGL
jgi:DNA integrity scanning protein DisA with diadenylate cyclase activity